MLDCRRATMPQYQLGARRGFALLREERDDIFSSDDDDESLERTEYLVCVWYNKKVNPQPGGTFLHGIRRYHAYEIDFQICRSITTSRRI